MNLAELIRRAQEALTAAIATYRTAQDALVALRSADGLTVEAVNEASAARDTASATVDTRQAELAELLAEQARETEVAEMASRVTPTGTRMPAYDQVARIGSEKRTYSPDNAREGISFLADVVGMTAGNLGAMQRAQQHMSEERVERSHLFQRDVGTGAFAGLTVPQYLTDLVAPKVTAKRPLLDICRKLPLPATGNTVNISRITTSTGVAAQATENSAVQETDIDDTLLTVNVRTYAGQQDVARQAIDRSAGAEQVIIEDLSKQYHTTVDSAAINADGTSGTHLGIRSTTSIIAVTYTDSTGTPSEAWGPLWDLASQVETGVFEPITHFVMHPRRWNFYASAIGTNQAMMGFNGAAPLQIGSEGVKTASGVRGFLAGVPVLVDANIPTTISSTTDVILGVTDSELFLWEQEGSPLMIRADQVGAGSLTIKFVVYGYSAFTAGRRPGAHGTISGSGLGTPTFGIAAS